MTRQLKQPRMSTWVKLYGPFREVSRAEAQAHPDRAFTVLLNDNPRGCDFGCPGVHWVNTVGYYLASKPLPQEDATTDYNVLGVWAKGGLK